MIFYLQLDRVISCNFRVLQFRAKKADKHEVLSRTKLANILSQCEKSSGDIYEKAAILLCEVTKQHAFASGNRRTAVLVAKEFITDNGREFGIPDDPLNARILQGIREDFYT